MPAFLGIDHIAITVLDLDVSLPFYERVFGLSPVGTMDDGPFVRRILALPGGVTLGLTQHDQATSNSRFDPRVPGLDHIGFAVADLAELSGWATHLDSHGIQNSGLVDASYGTAVSFTDPDGTALEFFVGK